MKAIRRFTVRTVLPESIGALDALAGNLRWSWHAPTECLFRDLDPRAWADSGQDPIAFLGSMTRGQLDRISTDPTLVERIQRLGADLARYLREPRWYQSLGPEVPRCIAYFSPEYGISSVLPQYSGGLGILAGDHLKTASDLGLPLVGVGLLYQAGYFRQSLSRDAWQQESYPVLDPDGLPLTLLREADGSPAEVSLPLPHGRRLGARIWRADVGRVPLLLLDSNVPGNDDAARNVTDRLYGGGGDQRLQQELLLGIGGVRALRVLERLDGTPAPEVFHTNEGHAGFLGVERIRELMVPDAGGGLSWPEALAAVRASTVFTTHTPVPAGIDRFDRAQVEHVLAAGAAPGVPLDGVLNLGAESYDGGDPGTFNMAVMGLRLAQRANGVARLHGSVSREMFSGLWPGFDTVEVPIDFVTNGVHVPTWVAPEISDFARERFGSDSVTGSHWYRVHDVSDGDIRALRRRLRERLVADVRRRIRGSWQDRGAAEAELAWTDSILDPAVLTIGFARRVPTYKRLTLMLRDPDRLRALLLHPERPVQLVIAGKSHPADEQGKRLIQSLVQFTDDPQVRHRMVFLPNYDMAMARTLFPGCDVWLNNPLRPLEACGTSGMKSAINGGLNLSVLDGWWDEMYDGANGWAIPTADNRASVDERDDIEAAALYALLESEVAPAFYAEDGKWASMIRHTMATLGPAVSAERMLRDYVERLYRPACTFGRAAAAESYAGARELAAWTARVRQAWPGVAVEHVDSLGIGDEPRIGDSLTVHAYIALGTLRPGDIAAEVVYGRASESDDISAASSSPLLPDEDLGGGRYRFSGAVPIDHAGPFGYTVRVLPVHPLLASRAELALTAVPSGSRNSLGDR